MRTKSGVALLSSTLILVGGAASMSGAADPHAGSVPKGLPPLAHPADNPSTPEKIALGKQLYFDPRLSADDKVSCATCHDPDKGWSNGEKFGVGIDGKKGGRNTPTILNSAYSHFQFWDGRAVHLEGQALGPVANPIEMNLPLDQMEKKLNKIAGYRTQFKQVFGAEEITAPLVAKALAAFERTILSGDAPYDRFVAGDKTALSESAQRGLKLFEGKGNCKACHSGPSFSDFAFHNLGVGIDHPTPDPGRKAVSNLDGDHGAFKTPTLREIARTAPYMHDGGHATLEEVVDYYDRGGTANDQLDEEIFPLKLTAQEKADLVTFLKEGLSSASYPHVKAPELPK